MHTAKQWNFNEWRRKERFISKANETFNNRCCACTAIGASIEPGEVWLSVESSVTFNHHAFVGPVTVEFGVRIVWPET